MNSKRLRASRPPLVHRDEQFADLEESKHSDAQSEEHDKDDWYMAIDDINSDHDSDWKEAVSKSTDVSEEIKRLLENITQGYKLSYRDVRDFQQLREAPLNTLTLEKVKRLIKYGRERVKKESSHLLKPPAEEIAKQAGGKKRSLKKLSKFAEEPASQSRFPIQQEVADAKTDHTLALQLIENFHKLDPAMKERLLTLVDEHLHSDKELLSQALKQQVALYVATARSYYDHKKMLQLEQLLSSLSPAAAIMVNFEISLANQTYMEESATLSVTLLPYINKVTDFSFLVEETHFIAGRFLNSLVLHITDLNESVTFGFILFAMHLNPRVLKGMITSIDSKTALREALTYKGYSLTTINLICLYPDKFLFPELQNYWQGQTVIIIEQSAAILAKMNILTDPGSQMPLLVETLAQRSLLIKLLLQTQRISLSMQQLICILQRLGPMKSESIESCLAEDSTKWEQLSAQLSNLEEFKESTLTVDKVQAFFHEHTQGLTQVCPLEEMFNVSKTISEEVQDYRHSPYQTAIAGIAVSQESLFTIIVSPTGSGKTWIQALISKYFCKKGKQVLIVEPTEHLGQQTTFKVITVDYNISVISIERFYEECPKYDVLILNEYDQIINTHAYSLQQNSIRGLWQLRQSKVFAFSATSSASYERFVSNSINNPTVLKFKSEYELIHNVNPVVDATVVTATNSGMLFDFIERDIAKFYDQQPIIIVLEQNQREKIKEIIRRHKLRWQGACTVESLEQVRFWEYGILLLSREEGRGIDTRFKRDAHVMILTPVSTYHELQQMVGRSSRSRGVCQGTLYVMGEEKQFQVIEKIKRQGIIALQEKEKLILLLERKQKDISLIRKIQEIRSNGKAIQSLTDLKEMLDDQTYAKMIKGLFN